MTRKLTIVLLATLLGVAFLPLSAAVAQQPEAGWLALETARDYRKAARYPEWSRALEAGAEDPLRAKRVPGKITARDPEGEGPALTVWSKKVSYEVGSPVTFFATVDGGSPIAVTGEVASAAGEPLGALAFFDDGAAPDKRAGDGLYTARFEVPAAHRPRLAASFLVKIQATFADGTSRFATSGFLYSRPHARLVGRYRDQARGGNLVISARVEVVEAGRFHLAGTLHTLAGEPVGTAQTVVELAPGRHWVDLEFYGLMFHDRAVTGPFRLGSLALTTTGAMPNGLSDLVEDAHVTRPVTAKSFTRRPFAQPELLEAAKRLELEALRSRLERGE